jgi:phenylpropionate dioxygenase-like ring-hydroxylating dioxygenase large terminal subunit
MSLLSSKVPWSISLSRDVTNRPKKITIEGNNYALFRSSKGVHLIDDTCPHRGASLSMGKQKGDCVQCPYHGWEYDGCGSLVKVPTTDNLPVKADVNSYNVVESGGFVWLANEEHDIPTKHCAELFGNEYNRVYGSKTLDGNMFDWIMNGVDVSHINYVHDFADENDGRVTEMVVNTDDDYVDCYAVVRPKASSVVTSHMQPEEGSSRIHSRFFVPNTTIIKIKLREPLEFTTFTSLLPVTETKTKMTWCFAYPKNAMFNLPFFEKRFHDKMYAAVAQDERIVSSLYPLGVRYDVNVKTDEYQTQVLKKLGF